MSCLSPPWTRSGISFLPYRSFSCYYFLVSSPAQSLIPYNVTSAPIFQIIYCLRRFHCLLPLLSLDTSNTMLFPPGIAPISFLTPLQQFLTWVSAGPPPFHMPEGENLEFRPWTSFSSTKALYTHTPKVKLCLQPVLTTASLSLRLKFRIMSSHFPLPNTISYQKSIKSYWVYKTLGIMCEQNKCDHCLPSWNL